MRVLPIILIALSLCGPALAQDLTAARFRLGMAAMQLATRAEPDKREELLDKAIAAFRAILVKQPELVRVRLELARAFFLKEEDRLARRHFELVLAGKPPAGVALNVNRFLSVMRARKRWSLNASARRSRPTPISARARTSGSSISISPASSCPSAATRKSSPPRVSGSRPGSVGSTSCRSAGPRPGPGRANGGCAPAATSVAQGVPRRASLTG